MTRRIRADWRIDGSTLIGERKGTRLIEIPLETIDVAADVGSLRGRGLRFRPFRGRVLRLECEVDGVRHLLGIPMPDPASWIAAIDAARR